MLEIYRAMPNKVVLIGKIEKKKKFINENFMDDFFMFNRGKDYLKIDKYTVFHLIGQEDLIKEDNSRIDPCLDGAIAFIYIDADPVIKDLFEKRRSKDAIAIDLESIELMPFKCPGKIDNLIQLAKHRKEEALQKSMLVLGASKDNSEQSLSLFSMLPFDPTFVITKQLYDATYKNGFFSSPKDIKDADELQENSKLQRAQ
jgi:hypothetical protein